MVNFKRIAFLALRVVECCMFCTYSWYFVCILTSLHPVPIIWFTPSKRMSGNCDMKPDATLGVAVRSDCSKLRTICRRSSKWLSGLSSTKQ
ncbi:hypothetical protein T06_15794 [Trichinella sp. T6]|nr:hypothetical protein T06_15794 [Trichinella sp. T6]